MSYDLFFTTRRRTRPEWHTLAEWARSERYFTIQEAGEEHGILAYHNPNTGVYFSLTRAAPHRVAEASPNADLSFSVNYCRPSFFMREAVISLASLCKRFELDVVDPQGNHDGAQAMNADALIASWQRGNHFAVDALTSLDAQPQYTMPTSAALSFWRFAYDRPVLQAMTHDEYFVPQLQLVTVGEDSRVYRCAFLTEPTYYIMPEADFFMLHRDNSYAIVDAAPITEALTPYLTPLPELQGRYACISEFTLFDTDVIDIWDALHAHLPSLYPLTLLRRVESDGFIDSIPGALRAASAGEVVDEHSEEHASSWSREGG